MSKLRVNSSSPLVAYLLAVFSFLIWGTSFTVGKLISPVPFSPLNITFFRSAIGAFTVFCLIAAMGKLKEWFTAFRKNWGKYLLLGILFYACAFLVEYWALSHTKASNQAVLSNTMVFWVIIINFLLFKRKPATIFIIRLVVAIIGVAFILASAEFNFSGETIVGDLGTLGAYFLWAGYSVFTAKINEKVDPLYTTLSIFLCSLIILAPFSILTGGLQAFTGLKVFQWGALLYLGVICGGIAFFTYNRALSNPKISSEYIVVFSLLNPIIGVISGVALLQETIQLNEIIGIIFILSSIALAIYKPKKTNIMKISSQEDMLGEEIEHPKKEQI